MKILDVPRSGSYGGITSSRNAFGQYVRTRATPVQPRSESQLGVRARLSRTSSAWRALADGVRAGWASLGLSMRRTDALGQSYTLSGFQAHGAVNNVLAVAGLAMVDDAPALVTPDAPTNIALAIDPGTFDVTFAPTPVPADTYLFLRVSPQRSAGRNFEGDLRFLASTAPAGASPTDLLAAYTAKFGAPVEGNKIFVSATFMRGGFESAPFLASAVVAAP